ncbi:MAG: hypothetical protein Q8L48_21405 [Archangium sp.]|nr:hypothetical protein [Archangium sp.]
MRTLLLTPVLALLACSQPPAIDRAVVKLELISAIQRDLLVAMEAEKSAVLASADAESAAFAAEAKKANAEVERERLEVRRLVEIDGRPTELAALAKFDAAWTDVVAVDERLLALAVANTNLKASRLASGEAAAAVNQLVDALAAIEAVTADAKVLRELSGAAVAALRIHSLLAPHIASADEAEMTKLEEQLRGLGSIVEQALANSRKSPPPAARERAAEAWEAWARYQHLNTEIVKLSRLNTNVLSYDISVHEKRKVMIAAQNALAGLLAEVKNVPRATR